MSANDVAGTLQPEFPRHINLLKVAIIFATLMQVLDMTIANVALPHMRAALGANQDTISWVLTSYIVASAIAMPVTGWLADKLGRRRLYLWSVGCFVIASVLCGISTNITEMVIFRLVQGVSGAFLTPLAQTVLLDYTPPEKRSQAMAMFGMGVILGPILGPIIGGALTESANWRWVFFVNVPIGLAAFGGLWLLLPDVKRPPRSLDLWGFALLALGLAAFQLMLDRGQSEDWFSSIEIWIELGVAITAFWIFVIHLLSARNPLYSRVILRDRNLVIGTLLMANVGFVLTTSMALLPIMLEGLFGYPVLDTGKLLAARGIGVLFTMAIAAQLMKLIDPRLLVAAGLGIIALTFWDMTGWTLDQGWYSMAANGFFQGLGIGLLFVPISTMAFATLPPEERTDASGIVNLARSVGSSVGISIVMTYLARGTSRSHEILGGYITEARLPIDPQTMIPADSLRDMAMALVNAEVDRQAAMIGFLDSFYLAMVVTLCVLPLSLLVKRSSAIGGPPVTAADLGH
ncbi:MAG: MDR family MFS transporter [Sphingobium sp.]